jgi:TPR repeat protein
VHFGRLLIALGLAMLAGQAFAQTGKTGQTAAVSGSKLPEVKPASGKPAEAEPPVEAAADPIYAAFDTGKYKQALTLAEEAAARGDGPAHTLLGQMYEQGLGVPQNFEKAAEWYAKGAALGDVHSQFSLGVLLAEGRGVKENKKQAADFFELAASKNHAVALYNLSILYVEGVARPQDLTKAAELMEQAAALDNNAAQYDLAAFYKEGRGVPKDQAKAVYWLGRAAEAGHSNSELEYGILLFNGKGIPKNEQAGIEFIRRAAEKGNPIAQNRLARAYAFGAGVKIDAVAAGKWHLLSREAGVSDFNLDKVVGSLSDEERVKAEKDAMDWQQSMAALLQ